MHNNAKHFSEKNFPREFIKNKGLCRSKDDTTAACQQGKLNKWILKASVDTV
jgi:hypothetical protein